MSDNQANTRIEKIASFINGVAYKTISAMDNTKAVRDAAKAANKAANDSEFSTRDSLLVECATASVQGDWTEAEINSAATKVIAACNADGKVKKTLQNVTSEMKAAMHPNARAYVGHLLDLATSTFTEEEENAKADKDLPTPLKLAFARRYMLFMELIREAKNECRIYTTRDEVLAFAASEDPRFNAKTLHKRLTRVVDELKAFYNDCPVDAVANVQAEITNVTEAVISAAIKSKPSKPTLAFVHPNVAPKPAEAPSAPVVPSTTPTLTLPKAPVNVGAPRPPARRNTPMVKGDNMSVLNGLVA
jgi:hypothetical protein